MYDHEAHVAAKCTSINKLAKVKDIIPMMTMICVRPDPDMI